MAQQHTLAPWAELVPDVGPMTVDDLCARSDDDWRYELVEGRLVRMPPPGGEHGEISLELAGAHRDWVKPRGLGRVLAAETGFRLGPHTVLAGDGAFVRAERVPARDSAARRQYRQLAPDLVAKVASPSQTRAIWKRRRGFGWARVCGWCGWSGRRRGRWMCGGRIHLARRNGWQI